jgi:hypothetical protein
MEVVWLRELLKTGCGYCWKVDDYSCWVARYSNKFVKRLFFILQVSD